MERPDIIYQLAEGLDRLNRRIGRQWGPLSRSQWAVMRRLSKGPVPVGLLAERLEISTAGATRMLDKLEEAGFVMRIRHAEDQRQVSAKLTPAGDQALLQAREAYVRRLQELAAELSAEELAAWVSLMDRMAPSHPSCR